MKIDKILVLRKFSKVYIKKNFKKDRINSKLELIYKIKLIIN